MARIFARQHTAWVQRQLAASPPRVIRPLVPGDDILFRGQKVPLVMMGGRLVFHEQVVDLPVFEDDLRPFVRAHLWQMAKREFIPLTFALASQHDVRVKRVVVRNQRTRWGSCSVRGIICLNWRLMHAPLFVRDYLIIHELMHLRAMNHSPRFWRHVAAACPRYEEAEQWLDEHDHLLRES